MDCVRVGCSELPDGCISSRLHVCSGSSDRCSCGVAASFVSAVAAAAFGCSPDVATSPGSAVAAVTASGRFIYSGLLHIFSSSPSYIISLQFEPATCRVRHVQTKSHTRKRPTQSIQTDAFILAKSHTFLRKQAQPKVRNQKTETTLRRSRGNLASCPGFGVFVWWRGLSVWSFVRGATLSFTCDTSLNREETCLLVLAALLSCRRSVAPPVPSRLRPGLLGIYPLLSGRQPKNWPCTVLFLASIVDYLLWGVLDCVQCPKGWGAMILTDTSLVLGFLSFPGYTSSGPTSSGLPPLLSSPTYWFTGTDFGTGFQRLHGHRLLEVHEAGYSFS